MSGKSITIWVAVLTTGATLCGIGYWLLPSHAKAQTAGTTAKVVRRDFVSSVMATGAVKPQIGAEVRVGARISGKVEKLHGNVGSAVQKGQVIGELEKTDLNATVDQKQAELQIAEAKLSSIGSLGPKEIEKAEADLKECEANLLYAQKVLDRENSLLQTRVTTQQSHDEAREKHSVASARVAAAEKALDLARSRYSEDLKQARADQARTRAALEYAQAQLSYATISAPISGVVGSVATQEGETVAAGLNAPIFVTIIDLDRLQVDAFVDEVDIGKVKPGQKAVFTVDAFPAREFEGRVSAIYPKAVIQDNVVTYDVVTEITTDYRGLLRPEMTASVTITLEPRPGVLAIPARAIKRENGKNIVYVADGTTLTPREIKPGWKNGSWIEVASGLEEGQSIIIPQAEPKTAEP